MIKKHKTIFMIGGLLLVLIIILILIFGRMFIKSNSSTYGNRLKGIVKVSEKDNNKVIDSLKENESVDKVNIRIQGKIIYIKINYNKGTNIDKAKEIANKIPELYSEKVIGDYDLEVFLIENDDENEETDEFLIAGTKHPNLEKISYTKS